VTAVRATWRSLLDDATAALSPVDARWIVCEASGYDPAELQLVLDEAAPSRAAYSVDALVARRARGEPLQYVLGSWEFRGIDLMVDPRVLIPRPETEVVAQVAIDELARGGARVGRGDPWSAGITEFAVADLGTGSGALALALVTELPDAAVWATDASADALAVARANLSSIGFPATRVRVVQGHWFDALPLELRGELRLVVSNPPYVSEAEYAELPIEVAAYEPARALVSGPTGLECLEIIVSDAPAWLAPDGVLVCEHAPHQADALRDLALDAGFVQVDVRPDLTGRDRVLVASLLERADAPVRAAQALRQ
jgi:release factor glutamine methyltransferase